MSSHDPHGEPSAAALGAGAVVLLIVTGGAAATATTSDHTAPIIALIGAAFVALLTAVTTNRRLTKQLREERVRLEDRLEHERGLKDLDHRRDDKQQQAERLRRFATASASQRPVSRKAMPASSVGAMPVGCVPVG